MPRHCQLAMCLVNIIRTIYHLGDKNVTVLLPSVNFSDDELRSRQFTAAIPTTKCECRSREQAASVRFTKRHCAIAALIFLVDSTDPGKLVVVV